MVPICAIECTPILLFHVGSGQSSVDMFSCLVRVEVRDLAQLLNSLSSTLANLIGIEIFLWLGPVHYLCINY